MTRNYDIALIGLGNVNRAVAELIYTQGDRLAEELGFSLRVVGIADLRYGNLINPDGVDLGACLALQMGQTFSRFSGGGEICDTQTFIEQVPADILLEATYTNPTNGQPALSHVRWGLQAGKSVCTTNKGPAAFAAQELKELAHDKGIQFEFEGAVMSGTPVIRLAHGPLRGAGMKSFAGILNGTSNYVLGRMETGLSQEQAISEAQDHGYAEADPRADISGSDVRLKVMVLVNELFGLQLTPEQVVTEGITGITGAMVAEAAAQHKRWKLIGQAWRTADGGVQASVGPQLLDDSHPLAAINGVTNAVMFDTDFLGQVTISGPGAGRTETAYALLSDIIAIDAQRTNR